MITSKDAASLWLEASALFQSVLEETLTDWAKPEEKDAVAMLSKTVESDPNLQALAQTDPDISAALSEQEGNNASTP